MSVLAGYSASKFLGIAISNDKKLIKEIEIQLKTVQWAAGRAELHMHRGESQSQLLQARYMKVI